MEIFVRLIEALIWPITVFVLAFMFKTELKKIFTRLINLKYKDLELKFGQELENVEQKILEIKAKSPKEISKTSEEEIEYENIFTRLIKISEISPRAAITAAWFELENAVVTVARKNKIEVKRPTNITSLVRQLKNLNYIDEHFLSVFEDLRRLRNEAAHAPDFALTQNEAEKYILNTLRLSAIILMSDML
jgi:hypothetical protein